MSNHPTGRRLAIDCHVLSYKRRRESVLKRYERTSRDCALPLVAASWSFPTFRCPAFPKTVASVDRIRNHTARRSVGREGNCSRMRTPDFVNPDRTPAALGSMRRFIST